ncbi:unnamed protein product [Brassica rapa]|uniref:Uncharacterized protein n=2 Tax=Brassica TaxID=3705 RepID=A0A8D9GRW9_BRACM|nr:unnamed protein product [Brassica napus]CAG7885725.1 unnamed protein product [Brassica rapa]CDY24864.1 BnaA03g59680D [Brassica napus]
MHVFPKCNSKVPMSQSPTILNPGQPLPFNWVCFVCTNEMFSESLSAPEIVFPRSKGLSSI